MHFFIDWALCGLNFILLISGTILWLNTSAYRFRKRLLGTAFFILAWHVLFVLLQNTGLLARYAFILRTVAPFYYLVPPLLFFYARSFYFEETGFRRGDWRHGLLFLFALVDLLPYWVFTPLQVKYHDALMIMQDESAIVIVARGLTPAASHYILRMVVWPVYVFFQCRLLFRMEGSDRFRMSRVSRKPLFVAVLSVMLCFGNLTVSSAFLLEAYQYVPGIAARVMENALLFLLAGAMALLGYIFSNPDFLYGAARPGAFARRTDEAKAGNMPREEEQEHEALVVERPKECHLTADLIERLEKLMEQTGMYRIRGIKLADVAESLGVNPYQLSQALNSHFGQRFTDYINEKRIIYLKAQISGETGWKKFSIEGLAADAGFSSRTPFYSAFRKVTGLTPSEYIGNVMKERKSEEGA